MLIASAKGYLRIEELFTSEDAEDAEKKKEVSLWLCVSAVGFLFPLWEKMEKRILGSQTDFPTSAIEEVFSIWRRSFPAAVDAFRSFSADRFAPRPVRARDAPPSVIPHSGAKPCPKSASAASRLFCQYSSSR